MHTKTGLKKSGRMERRKVQNKRQKEIFFYEKERSKIKKKNVKETITNE